MELVEATSIFEALEKKNSYLSEFSKLNKEEITRLAQGNVKNLENFYYLREIIINAINKLDKRISILESWDEEIKNNAKTKKKFLFVLEKKRELVLSILDQDLKIISLIDKLKVKNKTKKFGT